MLLDRLLNVSSVSYAYEYIYNSHINNRFRIIVESLRNAAGT